MLTTETGVALEPLRFSVRVPLNPRDAFRLFTDGLADWWPLITHSIAGSDAVSCRIEPRAGGHVFERTRDGEEHRWATIARWEPGGALVLRWHPGRDERAAQEVRVSFRGDGTTHTDVTLEHDGFERAGVEGPGVRAEYERGWPEILGMFAGSVKPHSDG